MGIERGAMSDWSLHNLKSTVQRVEKATFTQSDSYVSNYIIYKMQSVDILTKFSLWFLSNCALLNKAIWKGFGHLGLFVMTG